MFETIGSFIDSTITIFAGIFLFVLGIKNKKPFLKWISISLIIIGLVLLSMKITESKDKAKGITPSTMDTPLKQ